MLFSRKKTKKNEKREILFKKEAYIPKSKLKKKERTVPLHPGKRGSEVVIQQTSLLRKVIVTLLWILFVGEVVYVVLFAGFFTITSVEGSQEQENDRLLLNHSQIQDFLQESWQGNWYGIIPKNNLLFVRSRSQEERILQRYPKLEQVRITKQFPHTLKLSITEKPYQLLWCSKADCFLVERDGVLKDASFFFQYPEEQGRAVRIQDMAEASIQPGAQVLEGEDLRFVHDVISDFTLRTGLEISGPMERPSIFAKEMRIRTNKEFAIFFNTRLPVAESLNTLMLVLEKEIPESEWDKIDYIDLRTENRIYYTRKDRAPEKTEAQKKREEEEEKKRKEEEERRESQ